ncbi:MAG: M48 family metalloprotease, partial [Desulfovibrionaceae bacterium]|nr:M48 family metalloprotease [Desulfovibrionaceae bacterium]
MDATLGERPAKGSLTRRDFMRLAALSAAAAALGGLAGCATNPVTGQSQLMLLSESGEIGLDRAYSPHQFSADYGTCRDEALNSYLNETGLRMARLTHRPGMPYSFRCVNAVNANAYAFPGGSVACTRGVLAKLENEAQLAALLGHELGHVNMRHTASRMSTGLLAQAVLAGSAAYVQTAASQYAPLVRNLGGLGAGMLLAHYSREDEREADALGMEYMTRAGMNPQGMVQLMETLNGLAEREPGLIEQMFATHPMTQERLKTAISRARGPYARFQNLPLARLRYMDQTQNLRRIAPALDKMQDGRTEMAKGRADRAEPLYREALGLAPDDYAGLVMLAECLVAQNRPAEAERCAARAKAVYPQEARAEHVSGVARIIQGRFEAAYQDFAEYDRLLPGNPGTAFL